MASASRYNSMMLLRIASPTSRMPTTQMRTMSTSLALRFNASRINLDSQRQPPPVPKARANPLIGRNFVPEQQHEQPATVTPTNPIAKSIADIIPPPPPPPSSIDALSQLPSSDSSAHPYTAADSSTPLNLDIASIIANRSAAFGQSLGIGDPLTRPKVRSAAVSGRTVFIKDRVSPNSAPTPVVAIRVLEKMCRDQKVRNKYHSQKFHERPGLKKKRLRSQRWRARFKTGFKAAVSRVMELKKQGW